MLKIWGEHRSLDAQKVMWLVNELEFDYSYTPFDDELEGLNDSSSFAISQNERMPVLNDNGLVVWGAHTILRYLAALYRSSLLYPEDDRDCPEAWMNWTKAEFQPDFQMGFFWEGSRQSSNKKNCLLFRESMSRCTRNVQLLDRALDGREFLGGEKFTLADVHVGTVIYRYLELDIERPSVPNVEAWYRRLQDRPSYREHVMIQS
ncbi:TPA: glutathione S-transferase [Pseudomonas aeruginosa]|nr:glutathione S-transferase [Pseudomonas aeruginosa]